MSTRFDRVVVGLGAMGGAALGHLARRGARVCGIERFAGAHDRGSSHGESRILRKAYFEHPGYVPLLDRAYELWSELEAAPGELFVPCGFLTVGAPDSGSVRGLEACYRVHELPHERLTGDELVRRWPVLAPPAGAVGFLDPLGGLLRVERCVERQVDVARRAGAEVRTGEEVLGWRVDGDGVRVRTSGGELAAGGLVLATGAWAVPELAALGVELEVWRKPFFWYEVPPGGGRGPDELPTWYVEAEAGHFYGFPALSARGIKAAEHMTPTPIDDPDALDRDTDAADEAPVRRFVEGFLPGVQGPAGAAAVCMYTMSPDRHFVIGRHPAHPQVTLAAGFSGHGFKFAPVVGEVLAELSLEGETRHPVGFLGLERFT